VQDLFVFGEGDITDVLVLFFDKRISHMIDSDEIGGEIPTGERCRGDGHDVAITAALVVSRYCLEF